MTTALMPKMGKREAYSLYVKAAAAAEKAAKACTPTPMVVGTAKAIFGPGSNDIDPSKPTYYVASGVCGFADIVIRPARGAFVSMLKARGVGRKGYYGGWSVRSYEFASSTRRSQSYEVAVAAAQAAAAVLRDAGIDAYVDSRLD